MENNLKSNADIKIERGLLIRKLFDNPRMNQYIILFDMLNNPLERFGTVEYLGKLSDDSLYIMQSFRILERKGLIESVGFFSKEKMFQVPTEKFAETTDYLINRMCKYMVNSKTELSYADCLRCFVDILQYNELELLQERIDKVKIQIEFYPNDPVLINILNKLNERLSVVSNN